MILNRKDNRKTEHVEVIKKVLLETLEELHEGCVVHCHYLPGLDQFFAICYVDIHDDDDAYFTMNFDYDEALQLISDAI